MGPLKCDIDFSITVKVEALSVHGHVGCVLFSSTVQRSAVQGLGTTAKRNHHRLKKFWNLNWITGSNANQLDF